MSAEELRESFNTAIERALVGDADLDAIEAELDRAQERVDEVRVFRGEGDGGDGV